MKKIFITFILIMTTIFVVTPINTRAITVSNVLTSNIYLLDEKDNANDEESAYDNDLLDGTDEEQDCDGTDYSLLGDPNDPDSVAWLLQEVLNFIKIVGPILVVVLSSVDFIQVIVKSDDEAMAKAQKKLIKRLIFAALLFFIPTMVQTILDIFGITSNPTCGIK